VEGTTSKCFLKGQLNIKVDDYANWIKCAYANEDV
jgi:hypothetical protein